MDVQVGLSFTWAHMQVCTQAISYECVTKSYFFFFPYKPYVVGILKNCLNETVHFEHPKLCTGRVVTNVVRTCDPTPLLYFLGNEIRLN